METRKKVVGGRRPRFIFSERERKQQLGVKKGGNGDRMPRRRVIEMVMVGKVADSPRTWKRKELGKRGRGKIQGNTAAEGKKAEKEGNGDVKRLELVGAAAGFVGVAIALLKMRRERKGYVRFVDLPDEPIMEGEGHVDE